ncbi:TetR/AcrR family transcriptional regulator [Streptosporangium canum]|uniref:TetR/AcrR family transcriptional regulator n=1 Tax=Streptosporangium canum TaxID=324952 RepID=UPI0033AFA180
MSSTATPEPEARGRTRRAILSAAASVLARDRTATLADIAEVAGVGRTALDGCFSDREELVRAVVEDSFGAVDRSLNGAALDQGPPLEAMRRLVAALVDVGDRLRFLYGDPHILPGFQAGGGPASTGRPVIDLIERGQAEGVFDPEVGAAWIEHVLWALVYTGCEEAARGKRPRHGIASAVFRTLENGIHLRRSPALQAY